MRQLWWVPLLFVASAVDAKPALHPKDAALLTWLDGFELPAARDRRYVIVTPPTTMRFRRYRTHLPLREAVLIKEDTERVTVSHGLWPVTYPLVRQSWRTAARVERGSLTRTVARRTRFKPDRRLGRRQYRFSGNTLGWSALVQKRLRPGESSEMILLARLARSAGRLRQAAACMEQARRLDYATHAPRADWLKKVRLRLGRVLLWELVDSIGRSGVAWSTIRARLDLLVKRAPSQVQRAARRVRERLTASATPAGVGLTPRLVPLHDAKAPALLAGLRDQTALHERAPLRVLVPARRAQPWRRLSGTAGQVVEQGLGIVPRLLARLDDTHPTRVQATTSSDDPTQQYVTVGELALSVLSELAVRRLASPAEARAWWAEVQTLGQVEELARRAKRPQAAQRLTVLLRLWDLDRERARGIALELARRPRPGKAVLRFLSQVPGGQVVDGLLSLVRNEALDCRSRYLAMRTLATNGHAGWEGPVLAEIQRGERCNLAFAGAGLVVLHGSPRALVRLAQVLKDAHPQVLRQVVIGAGRDPSTGQRRDLVEGVLVAALGVETVLPHREGVGEGAFAWEQAAFYLAWRRGERFPGFAGSFAQRERARARLRDRWRGARGLSPLGAHAAPTVPALTDRQRTLLDEALASTDVGRLDDRLDASGAGRAGIPHVARAIAAGRLSRAAAAVANSWNRAQAARVAEVWIRDPDQILSRKQEGALRALEGQVLTGARVVDVLLAQLSARRRGQLALALRRHAGGRGVTLRVAVRARRGGNTVRISAYHVVRQGTRVVRRENRGLVKWTAFKRATWRGLSRALDTVFGANPAREGEARLAVGWQ